MGPTTLQACENLQHVERSVMPTVGFNAQQEDRPPWPHRLLTGPHPLILSAQPSLLSRLSSCISSFCQLSKLEFLPGPEPEEVVLVPPELERRVGLGEYMLPAPTAALPTPSSEVLRVGTCQ